MNKLVLIFVLLSVLLSGCVGNDVKTYWMRFPDGREITVQYEYCQSTNLGVECWTDYATHTSPDAVYIVSEFKKIK